MKKPAKKKKKATKKKAKVAPKPKAEDDTPAEEVLNLKTFFFYLFQVPTTPPGTNAIDIEESNE